MKEYLSNKSYSEEKKKKVGIVFIIFKKIYWKYIYYTFHHNTFLKAVNDMAEI